MLALTAAAALLHRRHAPFFGLAALVYVGPFVESALERLGSKVPGIRRPRIEPTLAVLVLYALVTAWVCVRFLPKASARPVTPPEFYPVRAVDLLVRAQAHGNLAVPFRWGSYAMWRLYPRIKVSLDGRYEETYPDETFEMNHAFFYKEGKDWDRLLRQHRVDFIIVEQRATRLAAEDLRVQGYEQAWGDGASSLWARPEPAKSLRVLATQWPATVIGPLDPHIPDHWWR